MEPLLPLSLLFWGWQSHTPWAAGLLLLFVVAAGKSPWRWALKDAQYHRLGDLTSALFLGCVAYFVATGGDTAPIYSLLRWLPMIFAPLLLAQLYSGGADLPLSALFYSLRRRGGHAPAPRLDFRLPYALVCALAAGSGNASGGPYFVGAAGLLLWLLWPRRTAGPIWLVWFLLAVLLGYGGQLGLNRLQVVLEAWAVDWLGELDTDPFKVRTAIGDVGDMKLSSRIVLRVASDRPLGGGLLLKETAYDIYGGQSWLASNAPFKPYAAPDGEGPAHVTVSRSLSQPSTLLPLPAGLRGLRLAADAKLTANRLGAVKWQDAPPLLSYSIAYDTNAADPTPPTAADVKLPKDTAAMLEPLVAQLGLRGKTPREAADAIALMFANDFSYSLYLGRQHDSDDALQDFLYRRKAGHCEYFAAATALLLRAAGVPSRFVVGYSAQEYSAAEKRYLVRLRHAHAWTEAYLDGAWATLDNTPMVWAEREAQADPWWQAVADVWSRWAAALQNWRWQRAQQTEEGGFPLWGWLVLPLSLWLAWRLYRSRQRARPRVALAGIAMPQDADYARLEQSLLAAGHPPREPGETPLRWLRRLGLAAYEQDIRAYYRRRHGA